MGIEQYTANQQQVLRMFSFGFGSAVSADLVRAGGTLLDQGMSTGSLYDALLNLAPVKSSFPSYSSTNSVDFVRSVLTTAASGASIPTDVINGWATGLAPFVGSSGLETSGKFMAALSNLVAGFAGSTGRDPYLTALGNLVQNRMSVSSDYAATSSGQSFPGFTTLIAQTAGVTSAVTTVTSNTIRATPAVQALVGADGVNDIFIAVGLTAAGQYAGTDSVVGNLSTLNGRTTSDLNVGDSFDGKGGTNVLHVYGTSDLTGVTLTNIQKVVLHSDVTFSTAQIDALNTARATIQGDGASIMRVTGPSGSTVNMSNVQLQAIGQFDLAQSLTALITQDGLNQMGTVAARTGASVQAAPGQSDLNFGGKNVYGDGSVKSANGTTVGTLDGMLTGAGVHFNTVVSSVAAMVDQMNQAPGSGGLAGLPGYVTQDKVNLDVASMTLFLGSQTAADVITAGSAAAFMRGGPGNDVLNGGSSTNFMSGAGGDDTITGGPVRDFIAGDEGNDVAFGLGGNDFINTQGGNDTINGGAGLDFIMPGDGADTVVLDVDPDFISLYSSSNARVTDNAVDTIKFMTTAALGGGGTNTMVVGFEAGVGKDVLKFESSVSGSGILGLTAAPGNAVLNTGAITSFSMNTVAPGGILILPDSSFARGDEASANSTVFGFDAILTLAGKQAGPGVAHLIAVNDSVGNTNVFYDSDGSTTANNWKLVAKLIGVTAQQLDVSELQLINEA